MPKIIDVRHYNGAEERIRRLGLRSLVDEVSICLRGFVLLVQDRCNANSGGVVREMIDHQFESAASGWTRKRSGGLDWQKCKSFNGVDVCVGVEIQVSARSDLIIRDVVHIRDKIESGELDLGILVLPSDSLSYRLTDRAPSFADGVRIVEEMRVDKLPLLLMSVEQDGFQDSPLPKKRTRQGRTRRP